MDKVDLPYLYDARDEKKKKNVRNGKIVFIVLLAAVAAAGIISAVSGEGAYPAETHMPSVWGRSSDFTSNPRALSVLRGNYIAVLYIEGVIADANQTYNQQWLLDTIDSLYYDSKNIGMMLYIDSPGGGVYQSDEVYLALRNYADSKLLEAYLGPLAASGGYYIAAAADYITANRNTLTGSIGVIAGQSVDLTGFMEKHGISMTTITAGRNKNMMNINAPFTDEQQAIMQSVADECYEQFTGIVAESRGLDMEKVRELADGRIYTAKQAEENGLIDNIASFDKALDDFQLAASESDNLADIAEFRYGYKMSWYEYLTGFAARLLGKNTLLSSGGAATDLAARQIEGVRQIPFPAYYWQGQAIF